MSDLETREPPSTQTLSHGITEKLMRRIVDHVYPVDSRLPTERDLAAEFGVTRHVVREALKRLEAVGLVRIRQGSGIYVQDVRLTGGLDMFNVLIRKEDGSINFAFLKDVLEFRGNLFRPIARLAATRRTDEELRQIKALVRKRIEVRDKLGALESVNLELFRVFSKATHNRLYELVFNTLGSLSIKLGALIDLPLMGFDQTQAVFDRLVEGLEHRDDELVDLLVARYVRTLGDSLTAWSMRAEEPPSDVVAE